MILSSVRGPEKPLDRKLGGPKRCSGHSEREIHHLIRTEYRAMKTNLVNIIPSRLIIESLRNVTWDCTSLLFYVWCQEIEKPLLTVHGHKIFHSRDESV